MSTSEKVVIAIILAALTIAVVLLGLTVHRTTARAVSPTTVAVHRDALASHDQRLRALWRTQDQLALRLARVERDGGVR